MVLLGDLNGSMDDRAFDSITSQLRSAQDAAGDGFGFSWPAGFPVARIDQILVRGVKPMSSWVLPATGSDHLTGGGRNQLVNTARLRAASCTPRVPQEGFCRTRPPTDGSAFWLFAAHREGVTWSYVPSDRKALHSIDVGGLRAQGDLFGRYGQA